MKLLRVLSVNLALSTLLPILVLGSACGSDDGAGSPNGGAGGVSTAGSSGSSATAGSSSSGGGATSGGSGGTTLAGASGAGGTTAGASAAGAGGGGGGGTSNGGAGGAGTFTLTTPAFENQAGCSKDDKQACDTFPIENTNYGTGDMKNVSPKLDWTNVPAGTASFAVVFQDLSNEGAHWIIWNVSGASMGLPAGLPGGAMPATPAGAQQVSIDDGGKYFGPGAPCNVYEFVVYALNQATITPPNPTDRGAVRSHVQGLGAAILGQASIRARSDQGACN